jgi:hypothetical protein
MANDRGPERVASQLTTAQLVKEIASAVGLLAKKQIELAKAELRADVRTEAFSIGGLGVAAVAALTAINLLLVTAVLALGLVMPAWLAGLLVTGVVLLFAAIAATLSWRRRVRSPFVRTRQALKEDIRIIKERTA